MTEFPDRAPVVPGGIAEEAVRRKALGRTRLAPARAPDFPAPAARAQKVSKILSRWVAIGDTRWDKLK